MFKKILNFINNYKYIIISLIIILIVVVVNIIDSVSRVGLNMNVENQANVPGTAWFSLLTPKIEKEELSFVDYDGTTSPFSGEGTKNNPFIISSVSELTYINELLKTSELMSHRTNSLCKNNYLSIDSNKTITNNLFTYNINKSITLSSNVEEEFDHLYLVLIKSDDVNILSVTSEGENIDYLTDNEYIVINIDIDFNTSITIDIEFEATNSSSDINIFDYRSKKGNEEYFPVDDCYTKYYDSSDKYFKVTNNLNFNNLSITPIGDDETPFEGTIDFDYHILNNVLVTDNLNSGIFGVTHNATIKNLILTNANLNINENNTSNAGLIVGKALGNTKIYNIGINTGNVYITRNSNDVTHIGGIVGLLSGNSILTNSYSYANVTSIGKNNRGMYLGGLLGYRDGVNDSIDNNNPIVYLLVMYGKMNVSSGNYQFVYNGGLIKSSKTPTYCYYLWNGDTHDSNSGINDNYAILKSYDDMMADGFKAHLNNYRYMVNYYVGNDEHIKDSKTTGYNDIAWWYTKNSISYYPIIKKYDNTNELYKVYNTRSAALNDYNEVLKVNLYNDSTNRTKTYYVGITNKNEDINDYTNRKIIVPFNKISSNFIYGSNGKLDGYDMTLTGWKLTSVKQDGTTYNNEINGSLINYNYVLRSGENSASKDIGTIYAEGGFYLVPDGVSEITLTTKWAYTVYATDEYNDSVYLPTYENGDSTIYGISGSSNSNSGLDKNHPVSSLNAAYLKLGSIDRSKRSSIYDTVIMLVGNLHYNPDTTVGEGSTATSSSFESRAWEVPATIMSVDDDNDLNPDYSFYTRNVHDEDWPSIRFNFVNLLSIPQVGSINAKLNDINLTEGSEFEVTETTATDRIDLRHVNAKYVKLNGGYYDIYNLWMARSENLRKKYIYFGGYAKAIYLNAGIESRVTTGLTKNDLPVFVVSGGRIETLSATYLGTIVGASNDVYFYVDGGYIDSFYTTYNATLYKTANVSINNTYVNTYYAGGHTDSASVEGGVNTNIKNSRIGTFYGGPEYGYIKNYSKIDIDNSEIDNFFGGGYGGTQTTEINMVYQDSGDYICSRKNYYYDLDDSCNGTNSGEMSDSDRSYCFGRTDDYYGIETSFYAITYSKAGCISKAFSTYYSALSAANVDNVVVNLKNSKINNDLYGGGNKGTVSKSIVLNLDNTTVGGNLYGGGLSNENETLDIMEDTKGYEEPTFISYTIDAQAKYPTKKTYTWSSDKSKFRGNSVINKDEKLIYSKNEGHLGTVDGLIRVNLNNSNISGDVFGGGNKSEVNGDIVLLLNGTNEIHGNVYGGGNEALVTGTTDIRVNNETLSKVFGGGNKGNVDGATYVTLSGTASADAIYGGGNEASVTESYIYAESGTVDVLYGGSNKQGIVDNSNVLVGVKNERVIPDEPTIEIVNPEPGPIVITDDCTLRDIRYNYDYDSSNGRLDFSITNETDATFVEWEALIEVENMESIGNFYSGHYTTYSDGVIRITHEGQWYLPDYKYIDAHSTMKVNDNTFFINTNGDFKVNSVTINALGNNGVRYSSTICHDPLPVEPDEPDNPEDPIVTPEPIVNGELNINYVYGGNNIGGKTKNSYVLINGKTINESVYGGGNVAPTEKTNVEVINNSTIKGDVFGGGNMGIVELTCSARVTDSLVEGSLYGGGNGSDAVSLGDNLVVLEGNSTINNSVFGGGNAAETGNSTKNNSIAKVIITGGNILKNVYGGANTSKIWGYTNVDVGTYHEEYKNNNIVIGGTVFGGGEANASGSENYDYSYISVTKGIDMSIDSLENDVTINGSIFGSGNASSTSGYSNINIYNFGTREIPKKIVSIQRCSDLYLNNSSIDISGATDRTNEYNAIIYSLSRIDLLKLANNSTLFMQSGTNVVKELKSVFVDGDTVTPETVNITDNEVVKNTDNRIYMYINKAFNIIDSENLANGTFGDVEGMTFFGLYESDRDNLPSTGIYNTKYNLGDSPTNNEIFEFISGSYIMGSHKKEHDITKDGFFTNTVNETGNIVVKYIEPTPEDAKYYQWIVGEASTTFEIALTASKFATMGTTELSLIGFEKANTYFDLVSYNDNDLENGVKLINPEDVPRVANTTSDAMSTYGLKMSNSNANWLTDGNTSFISNDDVSHISGTTLYKTDNTNEIPSLDFIFVHSKNINEDKKLGSVTVGMLAYVPIDEVTYKIERIYININLDTKYYETDNYESSMTPGKEYELFVNSKTDITSTSSLSAYFSLFVSKDKSIYTDDYHRVLISNFKLPENTRITMIDRTIATEPLYYYYVVDNREVDTEITSNAEGLDTTYYIYPLSNFISMGSTSEQNRYNDAYANKKYYNSELGVNEEEFIFIVDYSEANVESTVEKAELLLELKDEDEFTHYDSLGVSHSNMVYNLYKDSNAIIDIDLTSDRDTAYHGYDLNLNAKLDFKEQVINNITVKDTNYIQDKMGLKLSLYNSAGDRINGATLIGTIFKINGNEYYADIDGSVRAKISDYVTDVKTDININLEKSLLPTDKYTILLEAFGSPDGLYYGLTPGGSSSIEIDIINENYGLNSTVSDESVIIDSESGLNKNKSNEITYNIEYDSQFTNPNIRVKLYRRKYDEDYSLLYDLVDLTDYVDDELIEKNEHEYLVTDEPISSNEFTIHLKDNLVTGTYRVVFELYNKDSYIDEVYSYMIIR